MSLFPSRDAGPWEKLIWCKIYLSPFSGGFAAARDSIALVHETSNTTKFMMKTGSEQRFPNTATGSSAIETAKILMRSRQGGVKHVH